LIGADLSGARLIEADLGRADLNRADLSGADLSRADLGTVQGLGRDQLSVSCWQENAPPKVPHYLNDYDLGRPNPSTCRSADTS
jgi:Pentapeptide repeats (8 copies)